MTSALTKVSIYLMLFTAPRCPFWAGRPTRLLTCLSPTPKRCHHSLMKWGGPSLSRSKQIQQTARGCANDYWFQLCSQIRSVARVAQWWELSPPTNVAQVRILASTPNVGWVCCWFSPLLREVFLRVLRFSPLPKNQHFQIPIRSGTLGHISTSSHELLSVPG